jgi:hypothetical protein
VVALILESPHIKEYDKQNMVGPAMGNTGCNIESMLLGNLMKYCLINDMQKEGAYSKYSSKIQEGKYKLLLINACQYQCSLGNLIGDDNKKRRDDIFKEVFQKEPIIKDFIKRVEINKFIVFLL